MGPAVNNVTNLYGLRQKGIPFGDWKIPSFFFLKSFYLRKFLFYPSLLIFPLECFKNRKRFPEKSTKRKKFFQKVLFYTSKKRNIFDDNLSLWQKHQIFYDLVNIWRGLMCFQSKRYESGGKNEKIPSFSFFFLNSFCLSKFLFVPGIPDSRIPFCLRLSPQNSLFYCVKCPWGGHTPL